MRVRRIFQRLKFLPTLLECFPCLLHPYRIDRLGPPSRRTCQSPVDKAASKCKIDGCGGEFESGGEAGADDSAMVYRVLYGIKIFVVEEESTTFETGSDAFVNKGVYRTERMYRYSKSIGTYTSIFSLE